MTFTPRCGSEAEKKEEADGESSPLQRTLSAVTAAWRAVVGVAEKSEELRQRYVFFDFDRTLTVVHVFKSLAGWVDHQTCTLPALGFVPPPHALTERGQLCRLSELGPAWVEQAFGGRSRIEVLRQWLAGLSNKSKCVPILVTRGYTGVARQCLQEVGLLDSFGHVYGNVGAEYGHTKYDIQMEDQILPPHVQQMLGDAGESRWDSKLQIMLGYQDRYGLSSDDIIFLDDDVDEVAVARGLVTTIHVRGNAGISASDVNEVLAFLNLGDEPWATDCRAKWAAIRDPLKPKPFAISVFHRKHLPVRLTRYLGMLEDEFEACSNSLRRIKMLLREPFLLLSLVQREFLRHMLSTGNTQFTLKALRPVIQGMQAQLVLGTDGAGSAGESASQRIPGQPSTLSELSSGAPAGETPQASKESSSIDGSADGVNSGGARNGGRDAPSSTRPSVVQRGKSEYLYDKPAERSRSPGKHTQQPSQALKAMVSAFQQTLLGLCPITLATAGQRRNVLCCHETLDVEVTPAEAVWARYEQLAPLGAGHFGEVFRARERCRNREVAVKQLERLECEDNGDDEEEKSCSDEVGTLRALAHPNLLRVFEVVKSIDHVLIVSELAPGGTLSRYLSKQGPGTWINGATQQIGSAVAYCHRQFVMHGDLKPENVLVSGARPDGSPLCIVCDFGHSNVCIGSVRVAAPGDPRYIAPEVILEEGLSLKSDIYMLGVTAFELLTGGYLPFFGDKSVTLYMSYNLLKLGGVREKIISQQGLDWRDLERLQEATRATPAAQELVRSMLARNSANRPTAMEVLRSKWLQAAMQPCKSAYDEMLRADTEAGWGLWVPQHPRFAERLRQRAGRSWTHRMLIGLVGSGLEPDRVHGARLLFRRMDERGDGTLSRGAFGAACARAGLLDDAADALFSAGDLHEQGFLDYESMVMLFLDLGSFSRDEVLAELRSVLNRVRGPCVGEDADASGLTRPSITTTELQRILCQQPDAKLQRWVQDVCALIGPGDHLLTAECLLRLLEDDLCAEGAA
eukprot:TRINITY_DN23269_c0_g1_i1.p1 TRINITY_DN23269_c0_g1~~TRINITY_DN23269_c0_g1_i1.p1  ORF type:complete len:1024 (-),score=245.41 TRINITY_DN23269_c0_g1_i1:144-3215(-)